MKSSSQEAITFKVFRDSAGQRQQAIGQKEHSHTDKANGDSVCMNPGISAFCSFNADGLVQRAQAVENMKCR